MLVVVVGGRERKRLLSCLYINNNEHHVTSKSSDFGYLRRAHQQMRPIFGVVTGKRVCVKVLFERSMTHDIPGRWQYGHSIQIITS
jgi:hypothetical protein